MKNLKKLVSAFLAVVMLLAMSMTAFAAVSDTGFSDVAAKDVQGILEKALEQYFMRKGA